METATEKGSNGGVFGHENRSLLRLPDQGHWRALAGHFWGIGGHWPQFILLLLFYYYCFIIYLLFY